MPIRINNINLTLDEDIQDLNKKVCKKLRIDKKYIKDIKIIRESIDARRKNSIKLNYIVDAICENEDKILSKINDNNIKKEEEIKEEFKIGSKKLIERPIIIGMGPAGMFAGLIMAEKGYRPIIIERGEKIEDRTITVNKFWSGEKLNVNSNVQFGEGGAGTFSDGKLTTRIKDNRCNYILERFVEFGAPQEIIYSGKPHIGTDVLKKVVKNIRNRIISLGGEIRFNSKLNNINVKDNKIYSIIVNNEEVPCENVILSIGHSARDTYEMLFKNNVFMGVKPFAIGVRVEHDQDMINESQYGKYKNHPKLKSADYKLTYTSKKLNRSIYSFCMCPGGEVIAAASEEGTLVTNGMSYYKRDKDNANSAIVVSVGEKDFHNNNPLSGMEFQRHYEKLAYEVGGKNYFAPVQLIEDFLNDKISTSSSSINPTYKPGYVFEDMTKCLPTYVCDALKEGFMNFDNKIKGFNKGIMTGIETRTSAPLRIERNEKLESISLKGLYPAGEGAGYAGGIISAAVDGIKVAEKIMEEYAPIV